MIEFVLMLLFGLLLVDLCLGKPYAKCISGILVGWFLLVLVVRFFDRIGGPPRGGRWE